MPKFLKLIGIFVGIVLLILILAVTALSLFVSPNRFKPLIADQVKKYSGHEIVIDGDLSWQIFPSLGVKAGHLELHNPSGFKQKILAEIDSTTINIQLRPLLQGRIKSSGISLKGVRLNLIKNLAGETSWQMSSQTDVKTATADAKTPKVVIQNKRNAIDLDISFIDITDATINWLDERTGQAITLDHVDLSAKNINLIKPFPLKTAFNLVSKAPNLAGKISLDAKMAFNFPKQIFIFDMDSLVANLTFNKTKLNVDLKGSGTLDKEKDQLQLENVVGHIFDITLKGKAITEKLFTDPQITGNFRLDPFNVKEFLTKIGQDVSAIKKMGDASGYVSFQAGTSFESLNLKGNFKLNELQTSKVHLQNLDVKSSLQKSILTFSPFTANFYGGNIAGDAVVDLTREAPTISLNAKLSNVSLEPLLNDLAHLEKFKLSGMGDVDLKVTTSGSSSDALTKNLNGKAQLNLSNGILHGMDIDYLVESAAALVNRKAASHANTDQTPFGTLTASAIIRNGVLDNKDFYLNSPHADVKGEGSINLNNQQINYRLQALIKKDDPSRRDNLSNLYGYPAPVKVTGSLDHPVIRLDMDELMKTVAQKQLEKAKIQVQDKIQERIQKQLPDELKNKIPEQAGQLLNNLLGN